jgi:hypothetical protein
MDDLLQRLKRERRWALVFFLVSAALIVLVQQALAPPADAPFPPAAVTDTADAIRR